MNCQRARQSTFRAALIAALAGACSGCFGLAIDKPWDETFENPHPRRVNAVLSVDGPPRAERWICRPDPPREKPWATKETFSIVWGEPKRKRATEKGEEWFYGEDWRWCGAWVSFIVPVPLMLPLCSTHDRVEFEGDLAVRASSRRRDMAAMGIFIYPAVVIPIPIPYASFPSASDAGPFPEYWSAEKRKCIYD